MDNTLLIQYSSIRDTILANVKTIGKLIDQAKDLQESVGKIESADLKSSLEEQVRRINETIESLIEQTDKLFDKYEEFVREAFPK